MGADQGTGNEGRGSGAADRPIAVAVFAILWETLADVLGTAATAALVSRAAARGARRHPELGELAISAKNLDYAYDLPQSWNDRRGDLPVALHELASELVPLLVDLAGPVINNHLARVPGLREHGLVFAEEEP